MRQRFDSARDLLALWWQDGRKERSDMLRWLSSGHRLACNPRAREARCSDEELRQWRKQLTPLLKADPPGRLRR